MTEETKEKKTRKVYIECITVRKIGLEDGSTSGVNQDVKLEKKVAIKLQEAGAIKVKI